MIGLSIGIRAGRPGMSAPPPPPPPPPVPASFTTMPQTAPYRVYQRDTTSGGGQGAGQGIVAQTVNVTIAGTLYARCRSAADGSIVQAPWLVFASVATGNSARLIAGVDARLGWFYLDLSGDGASWINGTVPIGMGVLGVMSGQSLMVRMFRNESDVGTTIAASGVAIPANGRLFVNADNADASIATTWVPPADGSALDGAGAPELLNRLIAVAGVNVGLVSKCVGQTAIAEWQIGTTYGDALISTMRAAGGKFEFLIWYQGHSDSANGVNIRSYHAQLDLLFAGFAANNGFAVPVRLVATIPNITGGWGTNTSIEAIRRAAAFWCAANSATYVPMNDITLSGDGVHPTQAGAIRQARHFYRALRPHFGAANDDVGARMGTPTISGVNITIPFTLSNGATALSIVGGAANAAGKFKVYKVGNRDAPLALDGTTPIAIDNGAHTITLKLASNPSTTSIDVLYAGAYDAANDGSADLIVDNATDGDGIAQGRPLYADPFPARIALSRNLVLTSPVYGTGKVGQTLVSGSGQTAQPVLPSTGEGYRIDAWLQQNSTTDGLKVYAGSNGSFYACMVNNDMRFNCGSAQRDYTGVLPTGVWKWVVFIVDAPASTWQVWIDGVLIDAVATGNPASASGGGDVLGIRCFGSIGFDLTANQLADEFALWRGAGKFVGGVPAAAAGNDEPGLIGLWKLEGNGLNSATAA